MIMRIDAFSCPIACKQYLRIFLDKFRVARRIYERIKKHPEKFD